MTDRGQELRSAPTVRRISTLKCGCDVVAEPSHPLLAETLIRTVHGAHHLMHATHVVRPVSTWRPDPSKVQGALNSL
jgi:hypothetical protein